MNTEIHARVVHYLSRMQPSISGQGGHGCLLSACRVVVQGFDVAEDEAVEILMAYFNPRCQPPWDEKDVRRKCREVVKTPHPKGEPWGWLLAGRRDNSPAVKAPAVKQAAASALTVAHTAVAVATEKAKPVENFMYAYVDGMGGPHHLIQRLKYADGRKLFFPYHWNGHFFESGYGDLPRVPLNAPEVKEATYIWLVEGEKCAYAWLRHLRNLEQITPDVAVTSIPGGVGGWKPELTGWFRDKHVCLIPDNDKAGSGFVQTVKRKLDDVAASVRVRDWPADTQEKWDIADAVAEVERKGET